MLHASWLKSAAPRSASEPSPPPASHAWYAGGAITTTDAKAKALKLASVMDIPTAG